MLFFWCRVAGWQSVALNSKRQVSRLSSTFIGSSLAFLLLLRFDEMPGGTHDTCRKSCLNRRHLRVQKRSPPDRLTTILQFCPPSFSSFFCRCRARALASSCINRAAPALLRLMGSSTDVLRKVDLRLRELHAAGGKARD